MMYTVEQIMQAIDTLERPEKERLMRALSSHNGGQPAEGTPSARSISPVATTEPDYVLVYDGGDDECCGAFAVATRQGTDHVVKHVEPCNGTSGHEAEYQALIAGLRHLCDEISRRNEHPSQYAVEVRGDSRLVAQQLLGYWKAGSAQLQQRRNEARGLLDGFASFCLTEIPSSQLSAILGR